MLLLLLKKDKEIKPLEYLGIAALSGVAIWLSIQLGNFSFKRKQKQQDNIIENMKYVFSQIPQTQKENERDLKFFKKNGALGLIIKTTTSPNDVLIGSEALAGLEPEQFKQYFSNLVK